MQTKFADLLELAKDLNFMSLETTERNGKLVVKAQAPYQMEKDLFWDKLKTFAGWQDELAADISVKNTDVYGFHTVKPGDTLSKLSQWLLGDAKRFMEIFDLNKDVLTDPNVIKVGQKLKLPMKSAR